MLKLQSLHIQTPFKNLNVAEPFVFSETDEISILIGNNGCGKSNLLEAISSIFAALYDKANDAATPHEPEFKYELKYDREGAQINIRYTLSSKRYYFKKDGSNVELSSDILPSRIIANYSGEELRMWNRYYFPFYDRHNKAVIFGDQSVSDAQRMLFINKYHWNIALLTMVISDLPVIDIIGNNSITDIQFSFNEQNIKKFTSNEVVDFVKVLHQLGESISVDDFKDAIIDTHMLLYKKLSIAALPKDDVWRLIDNLKIKFSNGFYADELSEGEKKQILIKFIMRILADENSLVLLDEPDSQLHVAKKKDLRKLLYDEEGKSPHANSLITTHSPTMMKELQNNLIYMEDGKCKNHDTNNILQKLTNGGMNLEDQQLLLTTEYPVLLVEGKSDIAYIKRAISANGSPYSKLNDLLILSFGGTSNAKPFHDQLRNCIGDEKELIILFDRDDAGFKQGMKSFGVISTGGETGRLDQRTYTSQSTTLLMLPNPDNFTKDENLIEDYLPGEFRKRVLLDKIPEFSASIKSIPRDIRENVKSSLESSLMDEEDSILKGFVPLLDKLLAIINETDALTPIQ